MVLLFLFVTKNDTFIFSLLRIKTNVQCKTGMSDKIHISTIVYNVNVLQVLFYTIHCIIQHLCIQYRKYVLKIFNFNP